jgi:hypothetical protein
MTNSSQPIHPYEFIPESWVMETMTIGSGGLVIRHEFDVPSELAAPALTHHLIAVNIGEQGTRQVTRFGKQEYDGLWPTGSLWLATDV